MDQAFTHYLHTNLPVERGLQRFRELIIHVSSKSEDDRYFGATKLNKQLYYCDFMAFYRFGYPLTGQKYFRLPNGPAPKAVIPVCDKLAAEGALKFDHVEIGGKKQIRTIALRPAVLSHFTADELLLVDEVVGTLAPQNAKEVSDASHDIRWKVLSHKDEIPYEFAFLDDEVTDEDRERTKELAQQFGW